MRILELTFKDHTRQWELEKSDFDTLTLLVGASGVGKTQILKSIMRLKNIANGKSISGIEWAITFQTLNGHKYSWEGKFENKGEIIFRDGEDDELDRNKPSIEVEFLDLDGERIITRRKDNIIFQGKKTVKLSNKQSVLSLLKEEDLIKPAFEGFEKILFSDQTDSAKEVAFIFGFPDSQRLAKSIRSLEKIQESKEDVRTKLFLVYKNVPNTFSVIKERFMDIFPQIEDVKVEPFNDLDENIPVFLKEQPFIQIKEIGVERWIKQHNISSGMLRSLIHISEIYLCSEGTIFLIDEFENSLGINCINEITNDILSSHRNTQFIVTSHHPYIINNVDSSYWKLVTRTKGVVKTHGAHELNIGKSKHDAFMQLTQLEEYRTGLEI